MYARQCCPGPGDGLVTAAAVLPTATGENSHVKKKASAFLATSHDARASVAIVERSFALFTHVAASCREHSSHRGPRAPPMAGCMPFLARCARPARPVPHIHSPSCRTTNLIPERLCCCHRAQYSSSSCSSRATFNLSALAICDARCQCPPVFAWQQPQSKGHAFSNRNEG